MFELKKLPYSFDALEPVMSAELLELHYSKHHQTYTNNFNIAITDNTLEGKTIEEIFANISQYSKAVENHGGGYFNHEFFWESLTSAGSDENIISERMLDSIKKSFGSFDDFQEEFSKKALTLFGSGWVWLIENDNGGLEIHQSFNQESPKMDFMIERNGEARPILNLDVWEHAYYLDYKNVRVDFIKNIWQLVNWTKVEERLFSQSI